MVLIFMRFLVSSLDLVPRACNASQETPYEAHYTPITGRNHVQPINYGRLMSTGDINSGI